MAIPISLGSGAASIASEKVGNNDYQQVKVIGGETGSTSVWGITPDGSGKVSVVGRVAADISGSVLSFQGGTRITSVSGIVDTELPTASVLGDDLPNPTVPNVGAFLVGWNVTNADWDRVVVSRTNGDGLTNHASGNLVVASRGMVYNGTNWDRLRGDSSIGALVNTGAGSVITVQQTSSILAVPVGSVITVLQSPSIVGTYSEDVAHTTGEKGIFALGVRNDTLASVTSADGDYSPLSVGPTGAITAHDAPITKWVQGTADLRVVLGASVTAIPAQGASVFTYIREIQVANMGSASVLVTFAGGLGSILGYTIAPAGGGSNFVTRLKTGENSAFTASISGTASVLVSAQGFISKT